MQKEYIDALTYLSSFDEGLSHYNWDRAMTYNLKYGIHPGKFIRNYIVEGLIENEVAVSNSNYRLSSSGKEKVEENKKELQSLDDLILKSLEDCMSSGYSIEIEARLPLYEVNYLGTIIKIFIHRSNKEDKVVCFFPAETKLKTNEVSLSFSMLEKTEILRDLLESHLKYLSILRDNRKTE